MVRFTANTVVVDDSDDEFIVVGFADEHEGQYRDAIQFQRSYQFDDQDVALGMNQVYIERGIQSGSAYGGIDVVELYLEYMRVVVSGATAQSLGDDEFQIEFSLPEAELLRLRDGMRRVFEGFDVLREFVA